MVRKLLAIGAGLSPVIVLGVLVSLEILKNPFSHLESILYIPFLGGFLTGMIVRDKGWIYGMIPACFWILFMIALGIAIGYSQGGKLFLAPLSLLPWLEFVAWIVLGAIGGHFGEVVAKRICKFKGRT